MSRNTLSQSDCIILKSAISQEKQDESILYVASAFWFKKNKCFVNFWLDEVKNAFSQLDWRVYEWTIIFQVGIDKSTWFLACKYRFKK